MSGKDNLVDQSLRNGDKGHYEEMMTGSCGVGVTSDTFLPQETVFLAVKDMKGRKNHVKRLFEAKGMADLTPTQYFTPLPF